jgi:sodium/potassium-transporting ATPase subunit alpha
MFVESASAGLDTTIIDDTTTREQLSGRSKAMHQLIAVSGLCNNASFDEHDMHLSVHERRTNGDATDTALLKFAADFGHLEEMKANHTVLAEIPFNSRNKVDEQTN